MSETVKAIDPVCGMRVDPGTAGQVEHSGQVYYFCSGHCAQTFEADPQKYTSVGEAPGATAPTVSAPSALRHPAAPGCCC